MVLIQLFLHHSDPDGLVLLRHDHVHQVVLLVHSLDSFVDIVVAHQ